MKTLLSAAALIAALAAPAAANTAIILEVGFDRAPRAQAELTIEQQAEIAIEEACEKPFIRNLRGQQLYEACLAEARTKVEAVLAARQPTELASR